MTGWINKCVLMIDVTVHFVDAKGLSNPSEVEGLREKVYASLEAYTKHKYPDQPGRYFGHRHLDILFISKHFCFFLFDERLEHIYRSHIVMVEYQHNFLCVFKVCQAALASARPSFHRAEVPGTPVLLQAHWRHAHRHFPNGDAGSAAPDHMTRDPLFM